MTTNTTSRQIHRIQGREWWLWIFTVTITLLLTLALVSFSFPRLQILDDESYWFNLAQGVKALAGLVFSLRHLHRISTSSDTLGSPKARRAG